MDAAQLFCEQVRRWAEGRPDVTGLALVGSHARGAARPDSDLDLVLLVDDPAVYLREPEWTAQIGAVQSSTAEDWGALQSLRVVYASGLEVEFGFTTTRWASLPLDAGTRRVIADGMQVLLDRTGFLTLALKEVRSAG